MNGVRIDTAKHKNHHCWWALLAVICFLCEFSPSYAQTGGQAGIQGMVQDQTGAVVPNATVTLTNDATQIVTTKHTTNDGLYNATPILPGTYTVTVDAPGFSTAVQKNVVLNALTMTPLNITLQPGSVSESIVVTSAPPELETNNATLGGLIENKSYNNLPILMGGQQRDPTAFATLLPGAQSGTRAPIIGGTANYMAEIYVDGLPETVATQQGDNRIIMNSIPVDAIDQFQVQTSSIPPEYQGAGLLNFTIKSGTSKYHGSGNIFVRNTIFDTWTYAQKRETNPNRYENQNEISGTFGGPVPLPFLNLKKKAFFFYTYDRYHGRSGVDPGYLTIPTTSMRTGDFSELLKANGGPGYILYDPLSQTTCTANNGSICRYPFGQDWTGAPDTSQATNVIPSTYISPIAQYMQKFLPSVSNSAITSNYLGGMPSGYDNWESVARVDYKINENQNIALIYSRGLRKNVPYTYADNPTLPLPYVHGSKATIIIDLANLYHTWTITPNLTNQFKFGLMYFGGPPVTSATDDGKTTQYSATSAGITNLPSGQASNEFPGVSFGSGTYSQTKWTDNGASGATYTSASLGYTFGDNLHWSVGKHFVTAGFQYQALEANASTYDGNSGILTSSYSVNPTGQFASSSAITSSTGYQYASFLLGGVSSMATTIQSFGTVGGRYHPFAPYVNDDWRILPKLTLNLGFRWDYLPPYHEAHDRWSFLNPDLTNTITGNNGMIQFAGHKGDVSCNCDTPVHTYLKNFGPRLGLAYQVNNKTVIHAGYGMFYSHGGGVGGRSGAASGAGQLGYSTSASISETVTAPAFWLNNSSEWQTEGISNTAFGGSSYTLPSPTGTTAAGQQLNTGNYVNSAGSYVQSSGSVTYADPYVSGRAPTFSFWNFGIQRELTPSTTIAVNYVGSESHFLVTGSSAAVGKWANQLDPKYMVGLSTTKTSSGGNILSAQATSANIAIAQAAMPGISVPYTGYEAAGNKSSKATIQQMLLAFPQYSGVSNIWGQNVGNNNYHALQISLKQKNWKGLTWQLHYTFSKNIGDNGTYRDGYDIPADAIDADGRSFKRGSADRSLATTNMPQYLRAFGVYELPFGKGKIGSDNRWLTKIAGGWMLSAIYSYTSGAPLAITSTSCYSTGGTCMPNLNSSYGKKSARVGKWAMDSTPHIDSSAFIAPAYYGDVTSCTKNCTSKFGNAPRTRAYGLSYPSHMNLDMGLKREFPLPHYENIKLQIDANCNDVFHSHYYSTIGTTLPAQNADRSFDTSSFGTATKASGNRDWQFAAHVRF
jgi:hypothetical protein